MFIFSKIDLLGIPATLNFFGNDKRKSNFGGICSLLFFGFVIWATYNSSLDLFKRQNPNITLSEINVEDSRELDVSIDNFPIGWIVQHPTALGNDGFIDDSIYTIQVVYTVVERIKQPNGSIKKVTTNTPLAVEKCTKEHFGKYASSVASMTFMGSHCLVRNQTGLDQLKLQGIYSSNLYRSLGVSITSCINGTSDVVCKTPDEINKQLSGSSFSPLFMDNTMNIQNYSNPTGKYRKLSGTLMNPNSYKQVNMDVGFLEVQTDSGLITSDIKSEYTLKVVETDERVDLNPNPGKVLLIWYMQASRMETYYTRTYKKIPTILAEVGGLANVFLTILLVVVTPYLRLKSREALMNELFDLGGGKPNSDKKQKNTNRNNTKKVERRSKHEITLNTQTKTVTSEAMLSKRVTSLRYANEMQEIHGTNLSPIPKAVSEQYMQSEPFSQDQPMSSDRLALSPLKTPNTEQQTEEIQLPRLSLQSPNALSVGSQGSPNMQRLIAWNNNNLMVMKGDEFIECESDIEKQLENIDDDHKEEVKVEGEDEGDDGEKIIIQIPGNAVASLHIKESDERDRGKEVNEQEDDNQSGPKSKGKNVNKFAFGRIELNVWEYMLSFVYKPKHLREKLTMIEEGIRNIEERLDLSNILKKFCEVDKLIVLLLDRDQLELFNNMPKPQLRSRRKDMCLARQSTFEENLVKKIISVQPKKNEDFIQKSYERIRQKPEKSEIDKRLVTIFRNDFI